MNQEKIIRFSHVDDEVSNIDWIPEALRTCYYQRHREDFLKAKAPEYGSDPYVCSFELLGSKGASKVVYTIFEQGENLLELPISILKNSIILLDLMSLKKGERGGNDQAAVGNDTLKKLLKRGVDKNKIYMLTAFEKDACQVIGGKLEKGHILTKPTDATTLAPILLRAAGLFS